MPTNTNPDLRIEPMSAEKIHEYDADCAVLDMQYSDINTLDAILLDIQNYARLGYSWMNVSSIYKITPEVTELLRSRGFTVNVNKMGGRTVRWVTESE